MPATYEKIATTTLGSANSTITFSSIPATYTDLRISFTAGITASSDGYWRLNGDSGTNYSSTRIAGDGTTAVSGRRSNLSQVYIDDAGIIDSNQPIFYSLDIFSYAGSTYKTALATQNQDLNGTGNICYTVGLWRSTAAITSISLIASTSTWKTGTTATLYGILKA